MKNIRSYDAAKYSTDDYEKIEEGIYRTTYVNVVRDGDLALKGLDEGDELEAVKALTDWKKFDDEDLDELEYTFHSGKKYYKETDEDSGEITYYEDMYSGGREMYVTSLVFEPEPELDENEPTDAYISQYPLEDILDKFFCECCDDYLEENTNDRVNSYVEFGSEDIEDIKSLRSIIGKHVYNKQEGEYIELVIE
ncbi:MAG: hypothetical protein J5956_10230 [Ruminococcus sp.]|nr:hypothetical protein [Ruminococcus sp.]